MFQQWVFILPGSLIFTFSAMFFASRLVKDSNRGEGGPKTGLLSAFDLFFMFTSLIVLFVIWVEALRPYFILMVGICALVIWLGWMRQKTQ
ncbi:MAG: hypothetical protein AB1846_04090 [Chloroflexota bacterium]